MWVRVVWFDGVNHRVRPYLRKGAKLCVTGDASLEAYTDRMGQPAAALTVYPDSVDIVLYPKREEGTQAAAPAPRPAAPGYAQAPRPAAPAAPGGYDGGPWGPGNPDYDNSPDFLKDQGDDIPQ